MNQLTTSIYSKKLKHICFGLLVAINLSLTASPDCAFLQLDKNYLFQGEHLYGTLLTNNCGDVFPQVRIALLDQNAGKVCESWIRLDSSIQPFKLEVPTSIPEGLYQLTVMVEQSLEIIYTRPVPVFTRLAAGPISEAGVPEATGMPIDSSGLAVSWGPVTWGSKLDLEINSPDPDNEYLQLSVRISDLAQSVPGPWPPGSNAAGQYAQQIPLSSHTFALEGYLSDSSGNGCSYCPIILTIPSLEDGIYYTKADATGSFAFTGLAHRGTLKAYLSNAAESTDNFQFFIHQRELPIKPPSTTANYEDYKQQLLPKLQRYMLTSGFRHDRTKSSEVTTEEPVRPYQELRIYPKYDVQVLFDEYYLGSDMKRTIKSIIPNVNTIKKTEIRVFSIENTSNFLAEPLILLDGIRINSEEALSIDPRTIYKAEVLHKRRSLTQVGNIASNGILSFFTKNGIDETEFAGVKKVYVRGFDNSAPGSLEITGQQPFDRVVYFNPLLNIERRSGKQILIPLPDHFTELLISIIGIDSRGNSVYYRGMIAN